MSSDIARMKLRAQQSQVTMMHETTDRKGKGRGLQVVGDASHAFNSKAKGTGWVAEIFLYVTCSLRSSHRASISKGSVEIRGLTHFVDVPPHHAPMVPFQVTLYGPNQCSSNLWLHCFSNIKS